MFQDIASHESTFEKILSTGVLEWLVILVGCKIMEKQSLRLECLKIHWWVSVHYTLAS